MLKRNEVVIGNGTLSKTQLLTVPNVEAIKEELGYLTESGYEYLAIDIANSFGLDKKTYAERIDFVDSHSISQLFDKVNEADSPYEYRNAVEQLANHSNTLPVEHITYLDCTNQALQLYAVLTSCKDTAYLCNISSGDVLTDAYGVLAQAMNEITGLSIFDRNNCKKALMTTLYGKMDGESEIITYFIENGIEYKSLITDEELAICFQNAMRTIAPHAMRAMDVLQSLNKADQDVYFWTMPDGFKVKYDVKSTQKLEIACQTKSGVKFHFDRDVQVYKGSEFNRGMSPNVIHSVDGYVAREMVRRMTKPCAEFNRNYPAFITTIHDAFGTHPNNAKEMTWHYTNIMCELNDSNLLQNIMSQISGGSMLSIKKNTLTNDMIRKSIYKLS
jgi:DNA-directed RNA polymerase